MKRIQWIENLLQVVFSTGCAMVGLAGVIYTMTGHGLRHLGSFLVLLVMFSLFAVSDWRRFFAGKPLREPDTASKRERLGAALLETLFLLVLIWVGVFAWGTNTRPKILVVIVVLLLWLRRGGSMVIAWLRWFFYERYETETPDR